MDNNYIVEVYKGYEIESFNSNFTVFYCGDEVVFSSIKDAKNFIDEILGDE